MQAKIGLIKLLFNFKFSPSKKTTIPMEFEPINDMWLNIESTRE
jgi:hypothetical protein